MAGPQAAPPRDRAVLVRAGGDGEDKGGGRRRRRQQRRQPHDRQRPPGSGGLAALLARFILAIGLIFAPGRGLDLFDVNLEGFTPLHY